MTDSVLIVAKEAAKRGLSWHASDAMNYVEKFLRPPNRSRSSTDVPMVGGADNG